jgi:NADP-dependent 3-hydroxy acid dehydrogenase YdfG/Tfp pilus assembly protein PilF
MGNADIEDIFDEDDAPEADDINDIFDNITNRKSDETSIAPSEMNTLQVTDNEPLVTNIDTSESEEIALSNLTETEENPIAELAPSFSESEIKVAEIIEVAEPAISEMPSENSNSSTLSEDTTEDEEEQTSETTVMPSATISSSERLQMALNFAKQQNYKGATAQLEEVLAENPNNPDAYFLLAEVSELNQDNYSAIAFYEKVAELSSFYPKINQKLAHLYAANYPDKRKQTKKHFKKAIDLDEENVDLLYSYAEFLNEDKEQPEKAIKYFKRVLKLAEGHPFANYDLAMLYHGLGEQSLASEYYLEACENNPEFATEDNDDAFLNYHVLDVARAGEAINLHNIEEDEQLQPIEDEELGELITLESLIASGVIAAGASAEIATPREENIVETVVENSLIEMPITVETTVETVVETPILSVVNETEEAATYVAKPNKYKPQAGAKIVLITGATAGIGKATAEIFAKNGYNLILTGRREARLIEMQNEFHAKYSGGCIILDFDIRHLESVKTTFENLNKDWLNIDILVNNAGLALGMDPIHEGHFEHWDAMIDTNIKGLLYMTRMISPLMVARKSGHIINLCSTAGKEAYPNGNVYSATKFAVEALTRNMRIDLHKFGIRVGQVSPGAVEETEFSAVRFEGDTDRAAKIYEGFTPLCASDVAEVVYYMASAPSHVNIQDVLVMGTQQASATIIDRSGRS